MDVPPGENGSNALCDSPRNGADQPLTAAVCDLVKQMAETNALLIVLADQTAQCLAHMSILMDIVVTNEEQPDSDTTTYLDGSPII